MANGNPKILASQEGRKGGGKVLELTEILDRLRGDSAPMLPRLRQEPWVDESYGCFLNGGIPKSSILRGFSIMNHPFWGTSIFGNTHMLVGVFLRCGLRFKQSGEPDDD